MVAMSPTIRNGTTVSVWVRMEMRTVQDLDQHEDQEQLIERQYSVITR